MTSEKNISFFCIVLLISIGSSAGRTLTSSRSTLKVTSTSSQTSILSEVSKNLSPGQWVSLDTKNINLVLSDNSGNTATGDILPYVEGMSWDPVAHRVFYVGSDHNYKGNAYQSVRFVFYDEFSNSWTNTDNPPQGPGISHAYDHNAIDPATGDFFFANFSDSSPAKIRRYNVRSGSTWSDFAVGTAPSLMAAITFVPEFNSLLFVSTTEVLKYQANKWISLGTLSGLGPYHIFAEYNPVKKMTVLGGGNGSSALYVVSATGVLTKLKDAPIELRIPSMEFTVDPTSGDYLVLSSIDKSFRAYDVISDTWRTLPSPSSSVWNTQGQDVFHTAAVPISNYGVIMFVTCDAGNCRVNLYKHK